MNENMNKNVTNELLREILKWERLEGIEILKKKIEEEKLFKETKDIIIYYHSDGEKSLRDIEKITNISYKMVQALWKKWLKAGIATTTEKYGGGRCKRLFELNELGLELPSPKK